MIAIGYDQGAVFIGTVRFAMPARSLSASTSGTTIVVTNRLSGQTIVAEDFSFVTDLAGGRFADVASCLAYLVAQFAMSDPAGERVAVAIAIAFRGQAIIPLQDPPTSFRTVRLVVNGVEFRAPDIGVSSIAVTWLNPDFDLDPSDRVMVIYT